MQYLGGTTSTCATCGRLLPARIEADAGAIWYAKHCPDHGPQRVRVWSDVASWFGLSGYFRPGAVPLAFQQDSRAGCPQSCGLCPDHEQHVCLPILEITDHCDMACPVCLVHTAGTYHLDRAQVCRILDGLLTSEGHIDVLSLSGGEPTINPHFRDIIEECRSRGRIVYLSVSTNGRRLLQDPDLLRFLAEHRVIISLQFDGFDDSTPMRGRPLLAEKLRLIDLAAEHGARMSLTVTVARHINDQGIGRVFELLFARDHILSVMFQPAAYVGRGASMPRPDDPITIPDIIRSLDGACGGAVAAADFSPLACSHPACFALAMYLRAEEGSFLPMKRLVDVDQYLDITQNRALVGTDPDSFAQVRDAVYALWSSSSAVAPDSRKALAAVRSILQSVTRGGAYSQDRAAAAAERSIKSVFIHHFMDRHNFDLARVRKCCQVYPQPDGRLVPACVHNCLRRTPC